MDNAGRFVITFPLDNVIRPLYNWALVEKSELCIIWKTFVVLLLNLENNEHLKCVGHVFSVVANYLRDEDGK